MLRSIYVHSEGQIIVRFFDLEGLSRKLDVYRGKAYLTAYI